MYLCKKRLRVLIEEAQASGVVSDELALAFARIAEGIWSWKGGGGVDLEDFRQDVVLHMMKKLHHVDPSYEPFNYITTIAIQRLNVAVRSSSCRKRHEQAYRDEMMADTLWELRIMPDFRHAHEDYKNTGGSGHRIREYDR